MMQVIPHKNIKQSTLCSRSLRNGLLFVLVWVAWVACLHGWRASVGDVGGVLTWVACLRGLRASVCSVGGLCGVLKWVACYYYCYCYYGNTILKKKMLSV